MKTLLTMLLAGSLAGSAVAAQDTTGAMKKADQKTSAQVTQKTKAILNEAQTAMKETKDALAHLEKGEKKEAIKSLESATGKLEVVVARKPSLGFAPFDVAVTTNALLNDVESVNKLKDEAISALKENRVQDARQIISNLRSDTVISVANIPLATYPSALKDAARLIDQNKVDEAKATIIGALSTVVVNETVIPIPLARADYYIDEASKLSMKSNRTDAENKELTQDIQFGRDSLSMAEALGYAPKGAFKESFAKLDDASSKAKAGKSGENWFEEVKSKISSFFHTVDDKMQAQEEK